MKWPFQPWFSRDMAIDMGTSNTLMFLPRRGIVVHEPSMVALHLKKEGKKRVVAVGGRAKNMLGRTPKNIDVVQPIRKGIVSEFDVAVCMLSRFLENVQGKTAFFKPRAVISTPVGTTEVEKRALRESVESACMGEVFLIEQPMAAAIGAGLPITEPSGNMIVCIGGGTTEVAVISLGGIVHSHSIRLGGNHLDTAISSYIKKAHSMLVGDQTAEQIKIRLGLAMSDEELVSIKIKGRDLIAGVPRTGEINNQEIREAMSEPVNAIVEAIRLGLERTPPELASDIVDKGIVLSGGGALLRNLDVAVQKETGVPVRLATDPTCETVLGAGKVLGQIDRLRQVLSH
ncbi:MAG: rod shape-determining protein [Myxococcota bacterium]